METVKVCQFSINWGGLWLIIYMKERYNLLETIEK